MLPRTNDTDGKLVEPASRVDDEGIVRRYDAEELESDLDTLEMLG